MRQEISKLIPFIIGGMTLAVMCGCGSDKETSAKKAPGTESTQAVATGDSAIAEKIWALVKLGETEVAVDSGSKAVRIKLEKEENRLSGFTGCNELIGTYQVSADTIVFAHMGLTQTQCPTGRTTEEHLMRALEASMTYRTDGKVLELCDGGGMVVAKFEEGK
ncbi:MAG: META domain-containing protein [Candidatus Zixiibacteriota bacterium]